ncbi:MAG: hypothetical protein ABIR91_04150 [Candidatus Saccharimonadales bacterium]
MKWWCQLATLCALVVAAVAAIPVYAQPVRLEQRIDPIECIYTATQTGIIVTTTTNCDDLPVPTVTVIDAHNGRPIIRGHYDASRTTLLRVWLYGQWYTLGVDSRLTVDGDEWMLDLSDSAHALPSGVYTIMLSVTTTEGLVISNPQSAVFSLMNIDDPLTMPELPDAPASITSSNHHRDFVATSSLLLPFIPSTNLDNQQPWLRIDDGARSIQRTNRVLTKVFFWSIVMALGLLGLSIIIKNSHHFK